MSPDVSVIVPVYQQWHLIECLLAAMKYQTLEKSFWEVIIVDNGSDEIPILDSYPYRVTVIKCDVPGSYAARNEGVRVAKGRCLIFTDADCIPASDWLEKMYLIIRESSRVLVAGKVTVKAFHENKPNIYELYDSVFGLPQKSYVAKGYAVTANLGFSRALYESVGGFDQLRYSGGDADFCRRALQKEAALFYEESAEVFHPARDTWELIKTKIRRVKGGQLKHGSFIRRGLFFLHSFLSSPRQLFAIFLFPHLSFAEKIKVAAVIFKVWFSTIAISFFLILGVQQERR